jgi:hypothetical protein
MRWGMGDSRASDAIARIERAIGRIEQAAARAPRAEEAQGSAPDLRFETLRERVEQAVADLDRLIATAERG